MNSKWLLLGLMALIIISISHASILGITSVESDKAKIDAVFPKLIANTDQCLTDCSATFTYCLDADNTLKMDFSKTKGSADISYGYYTTQTVASDVQGKCLKEEAIDCDIQQKDCNTICDNNKNITDDSCTNQCKADYDTCTKDKPTTCIEYDKEVVYNNVTTWNNGLPDGKKGCYNITINGHKDVKENVDWMPTITINGFLWDTEYTQEKWAWWNTSYLKCRNITLSNSTTLGDVGYIDYAMDTNLTGLTFNSIYEIRIINASCNNGGSEITRDIITNTSNSAEVVFYYNKTAGTNLVYSVYYNYADVTDPTYSSIFALANITLTNVTGGYKTTLNLTGFTGTNTSIDILNSSNTLLTQRSSVTAGVQFYNATKYLWGNWTRTQQFNGNNTYILNITDGTRSMTIYYYKKYFDVYMSNIGVGASSWFYGNIQDAGSIKAAANTSNSSTAITIFNVTTELEVNLTEDWIAGYSNASTGQSIIGIMGKNLNASAVNGNRISVDAGAEHPMIEIGSDYPHHYLRTQTGSTIRYVLETYNSSLSGDARYYIPIQQDYYKFINPPTITLGAEQYTDQAPNTPILNAPSNNATLQLKNTLLNVTVSDNDSALLNVTFVNNATGSAICTNYSISNASTPVGCTWSNLNASTIYKWYASVTDGLSTTKSSVWNFTTHGTPTFTLNYPANNTNNTAINTVLNITAFSDVFSTTNVTFFNSTDNSTLCASQVISNGTTALCSINSISANQKVGWFMNISSTDYTNTSMVRYFTTDTIPTVTIVSPTNTTYNILPIWFNVSSNKTSDWTYSIDNSANVSMQNASTSANLSVTNVIGTHNVTFYALSSTGYQNASTRYYSIIIPPNTPVLNSPANGSINNNINTLLQATCTDNDTALLDLTFYNATSGSVICANTSIANGTMVNCTWSGLTANTNYKWYVNCTDGISVTKSATNNFTTDSSPTITVTSPTNTSYTIPYVWLNATSNKTVNWTYSLDGSANVSTANLTNSTSSNLSMTQGNHNITTYITSSTSYSNSSTVNFLVDSITPITTASAYYFDNGALYNFGDVGNRAINISLSCIDGGSGCNVTQYCIDSANSCTPNITYSTVIVYNTTGTHYIRFRSNDSVGNLETTNNESILLDITLPTAFGFINSTTNTSASPLNMWCDVNDLDKDNVTYYYRTFRNGILYSSGTVIDGIPSVITTPSGNSFATTGTWTNSAYVHDNNWSTYGTGSATGSYIYINYTKSFGLLNGTLETKNGIETVNNTIPANCSNQAVLQFRVYSFTNSPRNTTWSCFDGTAWNTLKSYSGTSVLYSWAYEQALIALSYTPTNMTTIDSANLTNTDAWQIECMANDGYYNGSAVNSSVFNLYDYNYTSFSTNVEFTQQDFWINFSLPVTNVLFSISNTVTPNWTSMSQYSTNHWLVSDAIPASSTSIIYYSYSWQLYNVTSFVNLSATVTGININTNGSGNYTNFLSTNFYNESDQTPISNMSSIAEFIFNIGNNNKTLTMSSTGNTNYYVSSIPTTITYDINLQYFSPTPENASVWATRNFIHYGYDPSQLVNVTLYDMPPGYYVTFRTLDVSTAPLAGMLIVAKRNYPATSSYESVAMCNTTSNGECSMYLYFDTVFYQIDVYSGNQLQGQINPQVFGTQYANGIRDYDIFITNTTALSIVDNTQVSYNISYNPSTHLLLATISGSGVNVTPYTFLVYQKMGFNNYIVYNQSSSTPVTTFTYNVTNLTGGYYAVLSGNHIQLGSTYINLSSAQATENGIAVILMIAALGIIFALALVSPILGLIIGVIVIIAFIAMGFLKVEGGAIGIGIGGLITALAFFLYRYFK